MATETSKAAERRRALQWYDKYFVGKGIDIGAGSDPVTKDCRVWDLADGDAQYMRGLDEEFDWVYSSHCLEHLRNPRQALARWWELVRVGGHLIICVPEADLYEQGIWPSRFNPDHKSTWTCTEPSIWSSVNYVMEEELGALPGAEVVVCQVVDTNYVYNLRENGQLVDQSSRLDVECSVEGIAWKQAWKG